MVERTKFSMQWHITDRCDQRCKHCYIYEGKDKSGAGRDTIYLIKNGWNVLAIDKEDTKQIISSKLDNEEIKKFRFTRQNFENIKLEKTKLLVANFSIPFCKKDCFNQFWNKIVDSILKERLFCG